MRPSEEFILFCFGAKFVNPCLVCEVADYRVSVEGPSSQFTFCPRFNLIFAVCPGLVSDLAGRLRTRPGTTHGRYRRRVAAAADDATADDATPARPAGRATRRPRDGGRLRSAAVGYHSVATPRSQGLRRLPALATDLRGAGVRTRLCRPGAWWAAAGTPAPETETRQHTSVSGSGEYRVGDAVE